METNRYHTRQAKKLIVFSRFDLCLVTSLQVAATARRVNWPRRDIRHILCLHPVPPPRRGE